MTGIIHHKSKAILNLCTFIDVTLKYIKGEIDRNKRKTKNSQSYREVLHIFLGGRLWGGVDGLRSPKISKNTENVVCYITS